MGGEKEGSRKDSYPKSQILRSQFSLRRILAGFKSRCMMLAE
jgi:hypothetical protein